MGTYENSVEIQNLKDFDAEQKRIHELPVLVTTDETEVTVVTKLVTGEYIDYQTNAATFFAGKYSIKTLSYTLALGDENSNMLVRGVGVDLTIPLDLGWKNFGKLYLIVYGTGFTISEAVGVTVQIPQTLQDIDKSYYEITKTGENEFSIVQSGTPTGTGTGGALDTITGDGVSGTPTDAIMTFPVDSEIVTDNSGNSLTADEQQATNTEIAGRLDALSGSGIPHAVSDTTSYVSKDGDWDRIERVVNFMDFVTDPTDRDNILNDATNHIEANNKIYWDNMVAYVKLNGITAIHLPDQGNLRVEEILIDDLDDVIFYGHGFRITYDIGTGATAMLKFTNSNRVTFYDVHFTTAYASYTTIDYVDVGAGCSFFKFLNCTFSNISRSGVYVHDLNGGASSEGVILDNCTFRNTNNYTEIEQTGVIFANDGEYCGIFNCKFYDMPSAVRFINGSNGQFMFNTILGAGGTAEAGSYNTAMIYADSTGTNSGKIDISYNKINHNSTGIVLILLKGDGDIGKASRVTSNDMLINGSVTRSNAIYIDNSPNITITDNKISGNVTTPNESGIIIKDSNDSYLNNNIVINHINGTSLVNSTNVHVTHYPTSNVTTPLLIDGTSSIEPVAGGLADAPSDGETYARKDAAWDALPILAPIASATVTPDTTTIPNQISWDVNLATIQDPTFQVVEDATGLKVNVVGVIASQPIEGTYATWVLLLADQGNQVTGKWYVATAGIAHPDILTGSVIVEYLGTTAMDETDYIVRVKSELGSTDVGEPTGFNPIANIGSMSQANYDAAVIAVTTVSTTLYTTPE